MPLSKDTLKSKLLSALNEIKKGGGGYNVQVVPLVSPAVAQKLADAYHSYAGSAIAGALTSQVTPGQASALKGPLSAMPLFTGWGPGMVAYWTPVTFTGPGFIPVNPTIAAAAAGASAEITSLILNTSNSEEEFAGKLAGILHSWTTKVQVTATTTAGVASTLSLS